MTPILFFIWSLRLRAAIKSRRSCRPWCLLDSLELLQGNGCPEIRLVVRFQLIRRLHTPVAQYSLKEYTLDHKAIPIEFKVCASFQNRRPRTWTQRLPQRGPRLFLGKQPHLLIKLRWALWARICHSHRSCELQSICDEYCGQRPIM